MQVRVLVENHSPDSRFTAEHGLSLHISHNGKNILFDTGASGAFAKNARKMGIDLADVDIAVLSHAHADHAGGLPAFFAHNERAPVFMSANSRREYVFRYLFVRENVSVPEEVFSRFGDRIRFADGFAELGEGMYLLPPPPHALAPGRSARRLAVRRNGRLEADSFDHELTLVIRRENELTVFAGCGHNGISNMAEHAALCFPGCAVRTVIGGFHLMGIPFAWKLGEPVEYIAQLGRRLAALDVEVVYTAHCTGERAYGLLRRTLGDRIRYLHTGDAITL